MRITNCGIRHASHASKETKWLFIFFLFTSIFHIYAHNNSISGPSPQHYYAIIINKYIYSYATYNLYININVSCTQQWAKRRECRWERVFPTQNAVQRWIMAIVALSPRIILLQHFTMPCDYFIIILLCNIALHSMLWLIWCSERCWSITVIND